MTRQILDQHAAVAPQGFQDRSSSFFDQHRTVFRMRNEKQRLSQAILSIAFESGLSTKKPKGLGKRASGAGQRSLEARRPAPKGARVVATLRYR